MAARPASRRKPLGHGMLAMHVALGLSKWQAAGAAAEAGWLDEVQPLWDSYARRVSRPRTLIEVLDQVAAGSPAVAGRWLREWLRGRTVRGGLELNRRDWADALPDGLTLEGTLALYASPMPALPAGLKVGGELWLDQSRLRTLPAGLVVGGSLWLRHCRDWDGRIPEDARVRGRVHSDARANGLPLAEWRARFPLGERPDLRGAR